MSLPLTHDNAHNEVPAMELHLDRLRRDRLRRSMSGNQQQRRSSRFSVVSLTPTAVEPRPEPPAAVPTADAAGTAGASPPSAPERRSRPTVKEVVKKHPKNIVYFSVLIALFIGGIVGWAIYLNRPTNNQRQDAFRGGFVVNGLLVVALILVLLLAVRQAVYIFRLFHPIPAHRSSTLPPWLIGRPPTYNESLRGWGTGDVEDAIIAQNETLPKYGETLGSTLLARSQSRGGAVPREEAERISMQERRSAEEQGGVRVTVPVSTGPPEFTSRPGSIRETELPPPANAEEAEARQIEEARRYQAQAGYTGQDEKTRYEAQQTASAERGEENWEEVALERDVTEARPAERS